MAFEELGKLASRILKTLDTSIVHGRCDLTVIVFTFGEGGGLGWSSSLERAQIVDMVERRLERWERGAPQEAVELPNDVPEPPPAEVVETLGKAVRMALPPNHGYALFCGVAQYSQYIASGSRETLAEMFRNDLLPGLRSELN